MSEDERVHILTEMCKAMPELRKESYNEQYRQAYEFYDAVPDVRAWVMQCLIDPVTLRRVWYWRERA